MRSAIKLATAIVACLVLVLATATNAEAVTHRTGNATPFYLASNHDYCISTDGSLVVLNRCSGSDYQKWYPVLSAGGDDSRLWEQKAHPGYCMTAAGSSINALVTITKCHDQLQLPGDPPSGVVYNGTQSWFHLFAQANWHVERWNTHCFGVNSVTAGQAVQMLACNPNSSLQRFDKYST